MSKHTTLQLTNCYSWVRNTFHSSAFACIVHETLVLLLKYKAISFIIAHISVALDKISLHLTLIFQCWLMCSLHLRLKYPYQLHCSRDTQHDWILALVLKYLNEKTVVRSHLFKMMSHNSPW